MIYPRDSRFHEFGHTYLLFATKRCVFHRRNYLLIALFLFLYASNIDYNSNLTSIYYSLFYIDHAFSFLHECAAVYIFVINNIILNIGIQRRRKCNEFSKLFTESEFKICKIYQFFSLLQNFLGYCECENRGSDVSLELLLFVSSKQK